jgi:lipopolysaccharide biosynthesis glycosyltransferase
MMVERPERKGELSSNLKGSLMRRCILSCLNANPGVIELAKVTLPRINEYAKYVGADFLLHESKHTIEPVPALKFNCYKLITENPVYDEILYLDTDVLIRKSNENIFEELEYGKFCAYDMLPGLYYDKNIWSMYRFLPVCEQENVPYNLRTFIFNAGVFLLSGDILEIIAQPNNYKDSYDLYEEALLNIRVQNKGCFKPIDIKWNCMPMMPDFQIRSKTANFFHFPGGNKLNNMRDWL